MSKDKNENQESISVSSTETAELQTSDIDVVSQDNTSDSSKGGGAALWLALLSLLMSGVLVGAAYYFWMQQQQVQQTQVKLKSSQATMLSDVNSRMQAVDSSVTQIRSGFDEIKTGEKPVYEQLQQQFNHLATQHKGQTEKIDTLTSLVSRSTQEWTLAEIAYLTRLANQRVQLYRDSGSAIIALKNVDEQLAGLSDPRNTSVREQLARDIDALKSIPRVDVTGMVSTLGALLEKIDQLPVKNNHLHQAAKTEPELVNAVSKTPESTKLDWRSAQDWKAIPGVMWDAVKELVTIRELDVPVAPMLPADKEYFLKQNLRLQMEAARVALLRQDTLFYKQSLGNAKDWIDRYFEGTHQSVVSSLESIDELLSVNIKPDMPDISSSMRALAQYRENVQ